MWSSGDHTGLATKRYPVKIPRKEENIFKLSAFSFEENLLIPHYLWRERSNYFGWKRLLFMQIKYGLFTRIKNTVSSGRKKLSEI